MRNQTVVYSENALNKIAQPAHQPTQVELHLNALGDSIDNLSKQFEAHREKLVPVTRPEAPSAVGEKASPDELLVPVADRLRAFERRITGLRFQLESLTDRVEA